MFYIFTWAGSSLGMINSIIYQTCQTLLDLQNMTQGKKVSIYLPSCKERESSLRTYYLEMSLMTYAEVEEMLDIVNLQKSLYC